MKADKPGKTTQFKPRLDHEKTQLNIPQDVDASDARNWTNGVPVPGDSVILPPGDPNNVAVVLGLGFPGEMCEGDDDELFGDE